MTEPTPNHGPVGFRGSTGLWDRATARMERDTIAWGRVRTADATARMVIDTLLQRIQALEAVVTVLTEEVQSCAKERTHAAD